MAELSTGASGRLSPEEAAGRLFDQPTVPVDFTPVDELEARLAVNELGRLFAAAPGVFTAALEGARSGAETLTSDRLQGLAEIIQNADDTGASFVRFQVADRHLLAFHDGAAVTLPDVLALSTPWLSTKGENARATGRFGIGLMTLRALSNVLDVHSGSYHVRLGQPTISAIDPSATSVLYPAWTVLSVPLETDDLTTDSVGTWLDRWDESALLFLRTVRHVSILDERGSDLRSLSLSWRHEPEMRCSIGGSDLRVERRQATAPDGRKWLVHTAEAPTPGGVRRVRKAADATVPLGVAFAREPEDRHAIYAGLPLTTTQAPVWLNAQFDPVTSRTGLAPTPWNRALLPLIGDLWAGAARRLIKERPKAAWSAIPVATDYRSGNDPEGIVASLERLLLDRSRADVAENAELGLDHGLVPITSIAVEDAALEGVIEPTEIAALAKLNYAFPIAARDRAGRWRDVLADWRAAGAPLARVVSVADALVLLGDLGRTATATIELASVAIEVGMAHRLPGLPWVTTSDGRRVVPPAAHSVGVLTVVRSPLAELLGVGVTLAPEHLASTKAARAVLAWLREVGAVIENPSDERVVRLLAAAGKAGERVLALSDDQLRSLRDAFEHLSPEDRASLGPNVGRAITIAAFRYDARGSITRENASPGNVYQSRAVDREPDSFAIAADKTAGLLWTDNRYAERLRSSLGRVGGLGAQKFLGLLGVERAPRLTPHQGNWERYADPRLGLGTGVKDEPKQRRLALRALNATFTLDDIDSPDLRAVVADIARERSPSKRRDRAGALLGSLGRSWDRLADRADVDAAMDDHRWHVRGTTKAFWLWSVGATAWLDDTLGTPQPPLDLRLKTPGTIAVHGPGAPGYLRPEFDAPNRRDVLAALGVSGEPSVRDLIDRLRGLRANPGSETDGHVDAALAYVAIADRLTHRASGSHDMGERELRTAFAEGNGLILTKIGWRAPTEVFAGPPIFRAHHAFAPQVPGADRLWRSLQIREPSADDCIKVIARIARARRAPDDADALVLLETLRLLAVRIAAPGGLSRSLIRRLPSLPLLTSAGWSKDRPVYAVSDPSLLEGLKRVLPIWFPGGEVGQFEPLLAPLRIRRLSAANASVANPESGVRDPDATDLFGAAVRLLHEDLARNDPRAAAALVIGWDSLQGFDVRVDPDLRVRVDGPGVQKPVLVDTASKVDVASRVCFLRDARLLRQVETGGRAIAGLFPGVDPRQLSQAWLAACIAAEEGRTAKRLQLAEEEAAAERAQRNREMAERADALGREIAGRQRKGATGGPKDKGKRAEQARTPTHEAPPPPRPRFLVDPDSLIVLNPEGRRGGTAPVSKARLDKPGPLPHPNRGGRPPRGAKSAPKFTELDK